MAQKVANFEPRSKTTPERTALLVRIERQTLREHLGMKDGRALSAVPIARHDVEIVAVGLDGHTGGLRVVPFIPAGQQYLSDRDPIPVKRQHASLAVLAT